MSEETNNMTPIGAITIVCALLVLGMFFFVASPNVINQCEWIAHSGPINDDTPATGRIFGFSLTGIYSTRDSSIVPGTVWKWDGTSWTEFATFPSSSAIAIWGISENDFWVGGNDAAFKVVHHHYLNGVWTSYTLVDGVQVNGRASAYWGAASNDIYSGIRAAVNADSIIHHWDGATWSVVTLTNPTGQNNVGTLFGFSATDIWSASDVANNNAIGHYDGISWTFTNPSFPEGGTAFQVTGIWGTSSNDLFASGTTGAGFSTLLHYNGISWTQQYVTTKEIRGLFGTSSSDVMAAGADTVYHYDGNSWSIIKVFDVTEQTNGFSANLQRIWAYDSEHYFIRNIRGGVYHGECQEVVIPTSYAEYGRALVPVIIGVGITIYVFSLRHKED